MTLLLVKHSLPRIEQGLPAFEWRLGEEGRARCGPLAELLARHSPQLLAASTEPKARETAELVGARLGLETTLSDGLREHARISVPFVEPDEFHRRVAELFARPDELVFGEETAKQALARFSAAVDALHGTVVAVTHGTVISLYVAARTGADGFELWCRLGLPSLVVIEGAEVRAIVEQIR
jgi:broad specificity phosphatase PhoE